VFEARGPQVGGTELGAEYDASGLAGAELDGAELDGAEVGGAELDGAEVGGAEVGGAEVGGAEVGGAEVGGAAGELVQMILTAAAAVWAIVEPHGAVVGAARAVARGGAGETWLVWGLGSFTSLSGWAGTADLVRAGDLGAWTRPACDCFAWVSPAGPLMNSTTTGPWCWPHQSPANTAPAPATSANTHAPVTDAADARVFQVPMIALPVSAAPTARKALGRCREDSALKGE
jgi:hypothetical protein